MDDNRFAECISYFKNRKVYARLFVKVREKYASLGHFGGSVQLGGLDAEDRRQLGGFFQKDFTGKKTVTITYSAMEKALGNSRFRGFEWEDILQTYFGEELIAKKERKRAEKERWNQYFADILSGFPENPGSIWLEQTLQTKGEGYLILTRQYREAPVKLGNILRQFLQAVPELPLLKGAADQKELLAVFAASSTGNPHFFDTGTLGEQLLTAFLKTIVPHIPEKKAELFYKAGILKDDLSNHTLVYGIHARTKDGNDHEGIEGFLSRSEPLHLTLMTIGGLEAVSAQNQKIVYIVENPAVFSVLAATWKDAAVICGNGQIRLSTLLLLDLFDQETRFFYAGDFDPEGLQIAQRLKERYGGRLQFWNYRKDLYDLYKSNVEISEKSLKKLDKIYMKELQEMKKALQTGKKAAYQEAMIWEYLRSRTEPKA